MKKLYTFGDKNLDRQITEIVKSVTPLPVFANNAAAKAGMLKPGDFYQTGNDPSLVCVVK